MTTIQQLPSFRALDKKMQKGYTRCDARDEAGAGRVWLEVWNDITAICDKLDIRSLEEFDKRFQGTQSVKEWIFDLGMVLWNVGLKRPEIMQTKVSFCEELLKRFGSPDDSPGKDSISTHARIGIAQGYAQLGDSEKADALFNEWLTNDPEWGRGWTGWTDCYSNGNPPPDLEKAERLLRKGLSVPDVQNRDEILGRLAYVLKRLDREAEAEEVKQQITPKPEGPSDGIKHPELWKALLSPMNNSLPYIPLPSSNFNRRKPCECGSGKMFKKCCGRGLC